MSRFSRNKSTLRQIEGRHSVIETLLSQKKVSHIDISNSSDEGNEIQKIIALAKAVSYTHLTLPTNREV